MKKRKYIITADDYGLCPEVNSAIEQLAEKGILSTTNVLTNFQTDFSNSPIKQYKRFSVGLHWNVTTGKPVTDCSKIPTLVDKNGSFYSIDEFRSRYREGRICPKELALELQSQYDLFYKEFGQPSYWNSHENSALFPKEYGVFKRVALQNGIKATRNFQRVYIDYDLSGGVGRRLREFAVSMYVNVKFGKIEKRKFVMPEGRIVTFCNASKTDIERMRNGLAKTNKKSIEVIIHPATDGKNPLFGNIAEDRVTEFETYMTDAFLELFENEKAHIVSFEEL